MKIRRAEPNDVDSIIELIIKRIEWMNENDLHQWNKTGYLDAFQKKYFEKKIKSDNFFIAVEDENVVGAIALFEYDDRWSDDAKTLYVHHLVTNPLKRSVGSKLLSFAERYAMENDFKYLRLDCQKGNDKLNSYYQSLGFVYVDECIEGSYIGIKREKRLELELLKTNLQ